MPKRKRPRKHKRKHRGYSQGDSCAKRQGRELKRKEIETNIARLEAEVIARENRICALSRQKIENQLASEQRWAYHCLRTLYLKGEKH